MIFNSRLNYMWMRYYPHLNGRLDTIIYFWKSFMKFEDDQNEQYSLAFSARRFVPKPRIFHSVTPNYEHNFVGKTFLLLDNGDDIFSLVWLAVVISGNVKVNETRTESWEPFLSKINWPWFFGDNVSENKCFALDKHNELKYGRLIPINEQWTAISPWFKNARRSTHCC